MAQSTSSTGNQPLIELKHVDKHYGDLHVLNDINLSVDRGEVVRADPGERTGGASERGADGIVDERRGHGVNRGLSVSKVGQAAERLE